MVPTEGTNWAGHDLELFPLLAGCLLDLVVWYMGSMWLLLVASPALNSAVWLAGAHPIPPSPAFPPTCPPPHSAGLKLVHTKKCLKSPEIHTLSY